MTSMPPVAVLAGGLGTRLRPVTATIPKSLVEVNGRPFIAHQLELFVRRGIREVILCVGYLGEQIEEYVGDGARFGLRIRFSYDGDRLRGTGGAIVHALPLLGDEFLVTYGDSYLDIAYDAVADAFRTSAAAALMTIFKNENNWDTSNIEFAGGRIVRYDKKNRTEQMRHIDYGLLAMTQEAFASWKNVETFDLADLLRPMAAAGQVAGFEVMTRFYETGSAIGIADLADHLKSIPQSE
jgi:NDP-sugar pyrophosphorylase family protein